MKKIIFHLCLSLLFLALGTPAFAQPTTDNTTCGKTAFFAKTFTTRLCYSGKDYPTRDLAQARHEAKMKAKVSCTVDCDEGYTCEVEMLGFTSGGTVRPSGGNYYAGPYVRFKWKCTDCTDIPDPDPEEEEEEEKPDEEEEEGEEKPEEGDAETPGGIHGGDLAFERSTGNAYQGLNARVANPFPNPTSGIVNLDVAVEKEQNEIVLVVRDVAGKLVERKVYNDIPQSLFMAMADLSQQNNGLYFLSTEVNGEVVGTHRILLQK